MGVKLGHLAASGFAVSRAGDTCVLRGCVLGSVSFDRYKDLFAKAAVVDFREVAFAGWPGVESFFGFLRSIGFTGRLVGVPSPVFEMMVLLGREDDAFRPRTAHLTGAAHHVAAPVQVPLDLDAWRAQALAQGASAADELSPGFRYVGCLEALAFPDVRSSLADDARAGEVDPASVGAEARFTFLYGSFLHLITVLTINHMETVAAGCLHSAEEILARVEKASGALARLGVAEGVALPKRREVVGPMVEGFEKAIGALEAVERLTRGLALKLQSIAREPGNRHADPVSLSILLATLAEACDAFCVKADDIGVSTFATLASLSCGDVIKGALARVDGVSLEEDTLRAVSEAFFVLDPFASESWDTLRPEIEGELALVDALVMNLVVDVQGFDAAKQVVEQRARELRHWKAALDAGGRAAGPDGLVAVVGAKLVTVHERAAFGLLLSHFKSLDQARVEGLEVNFFVV